MYKPVLQLKLESYSGTPRIFACCPYNLSISNIIKQVPGARYSAANKSWHLPVIKEVVKILAEKTKEIAVLDVNELRQQLTKKSNCPIRSYCTLKNPTYISYLTKT